MSLPGHPDRLLYAFLGLIASMEAALIYLLLATQGVLGLPQPSLRVAVVYGFPVVYDPGLLTMASMSLGAASLVTYVYGRRSLSAREKLREQATVAIQMFPTLLGATESSPEAVYLMARNVRDPPLGPLLMRAYVSATRGMSLDDAFSITLRPAPTDSRFLLASIPVAARSGGRVQEVMSVVNGFSVQLARLTFALQTGLSPYKMILALGNILYSLVAAISVLFLEITQRLGVALAPVAVDIDLVTGFLVYSSIVIALATSIIGGRIVWDKVHGGFIIAGVFIPLNTLIIVHLPGYLLETLVSLAA